MTTTLDLPLSPARDLFSTAAAPTQQLPRVKLAQRQGPILQPTPLAPSAEVLGLNLVRGCGHPKKAGDETLLLYTDTAERLAEELASGPRPRAVFLSPSTDPFPPLNAVQQVTAEVVQTLAQHGIESWLMTRGFIRPAALNVLAAHREHVKVTVALTTLDRHLQRTLEPLAAPPRLRLARSADCGNSAFQFRWPSIRLFPG